MRDNAYLYGEDVEVPELDTHMVMRRVELLKENRALLYEVHYSKRNNEKIREIDNAISFWEKLSRMN